LHYFSVGACRANDYHLEFFGDESFFYIVSPKDIVVAKPCDLDDHISWLHSRNRFEVQSPPACPPVTLTVPSGPKPHDVT